MNCPVCANVLTAITSGGLTVDACKGGCGGLWFDQFELKKVDQGQETAGADLLEIERNPAVQIDPDKRLNCPKCSDGTVMMRRFASPKRGVLVDECPGCGGYWLDAGELAAVRAEFSTEADLRQAQERLLQDAAGRQLAEMRAASMVENERASRIGGIFRFLLRRP